MASVTYWNFCEDCGGEHYSRKLDDMCIHCGGDRINPMKECDENYGKKHDREQDETE